MTNELATTNVTQPTTVAPSQPAPQPAQAPTAHAAQTARVSWHRPPADVLENESGLLLVVDLPGVPPDKVEVRTQDRSLTVVGVRTDRRIGWRRVFTLPPTIDAGGIEARSEHGVLYLTLPTAESAKPRRIDVR